jgi:rod shape-determining protein MreD
MGTRPGHRHVDDDHLDDHHVDDDRARRDDHHERAVTRPLRIGALILLLVVVQVTVFPHLRLLGAVPDLGLLLALAVAYRDGPEAGLVTGFVAGLAFDLFLETPTGLSALSYSLTAYAVGVLQSGVLRNPRFVAPLLGGLGGLVSGVGFVVIGVLVGAELGFTYHTFGLIAAAALYDAVLAPIVFALAARVLGRSPEPVATWWAR